MREEQRRADSEGLTHMPSEGRAEKSRLRRPNTHAKCGKIREEQAQKA